MGGQPLAGRIIAITRPTGQAEGLCATLMALGAETLRFPLLTVAPVDDPAPLQAMARHLADYAMVFFVSPNAVRHALDVMLPMAPWPPGVAVATVGKGSEAVLAERGFRDVIAPDQGFDSEAVLAGPVEPFADVRAGIAELLLRRLDGVMKIRDSKLLMLQAPRSILPQVLQLLPDAEPPTVMSLDGREGGDVAVQALCHGAMTWQRLEELKRAGARGLMVLPVERMLA